MISKPVAAPSRLLNALPSQLKVALGAFTTAALVSTVQPAHAVTYTFEDIIDPANLPFTQALGINDAGTIVGYGNMTIFNGFQLVLPASFTRLNVPGATGGTQVFGITANGLTTDGVRRGSIAGS